MSDHAKTARRIIEENLASITNAAQLEYDIWAALEEAGEGIDVLRKELWLRHRYENCILYGDDGEMQCNSCLIDFKRQPVEQIQSRLFELDMQRCVPQIPQTGELPPGMTPELLREAENLARICLWPIMAERFSGWASWLEARQKGGE